MNGTKKLKFLKKCVALLMVAFMFISVPVFEGGTAKAATKVNIPDANLKAGLNEWLGQPLTADITDEQLASLRYVNINQNYEINDLTGIEYCINAESVSIPGGSSAKLDLSKLSGLTKVTSLDLWYIKSNNYGALSSMNNLTSVSFIGSDITALPDLSGAKNLKYLDVSQCDSLTDIAGIKNCNNLQRVNISTGSITDITPLKGKTSITDLDIGGVKITDSNKAGYMSTISSLVNLEFLRNGWCSIGDEHTSMYDGLSKIKLLNLWSNNITDISFLIKHSNTLNYVNIGANPITDGSDLTQLSNLLNFSVDSTHITDFSFVSEIKNLNKGDQGYGQFIFTWNDYDSTCTYSEQIDDVESTGKGIYKIENKVKDHNGNYVAPVASDKYTYDATTNEITIKLDEYGKTYFGSVNYNIDLKSAKGENLYASHVINYYIYNATPLVITSQPESQKIKPGDNATFEVTATGENTISYQWYKDGEAIYGARNKTLNISKADEDDAGEYYVVVKDKYNNELTSDKVRLSFDVTPLVITTQPENYTADEGKEIYFKVVATGDGELKYQWYKDDKAIDGATDRTYTKQNADETDIGRYHVVVSDDFDSVKSDVVEVKVNLIPLTISSQPVGDTLTEGESTILEVKATGKGTLTYQWYKDDDVIDGATKDTLSLVDLKTEDAGEYYVVVKDERNTVESSKAIIIVKEKGTEAPTTQAPSTEAPTTQEPSTEAPTTQESSTEAPTTQEPSTEAPTTQEPSTDATTQAPSTEGTDQAPVDGPKTGDGPIPAVCVTLLLAAMASIVLAKLRKNNI